MSIFNFWTEGTGGGGSQFDGTGVSAALILLGSYFTQNFNSHILFLALALYLNQMTQSQFNTKYLLGEIFSSCFTIMLFFFSGIKGA